jgi:hypothetical protein
MKKMLNQMIKAKRRAMIKGEMRMMGIKEKHHHIQECVRIFKEITPSHTWWYQKGVTTRLHVIIFCENYSFISSFEPFKVEDALRDPDWVVATQEELNNFKRNEVWSLVKRPKQNVICIKCVFRNKQNEHGVVTMNKARLIVKVYSQVKDLDFDKTFAPIARLESIRMVLAYDSHHGFTLYQMDVKSAFWTVQSKKKCI